MNDVKIVELESKAQKVNKTNVAMIAQIVNNDKKMVLIDNTQSKDAGSNSQKSPGPISRITLLEQKLEDALQRIEELEFELMQVEKLDDILDRLTQLETLIY